MKTIFFALFTLVAPVLLGQTSPAIDSLEKQLPNAKDTSRVNILNALAKEYYRIDPGKTKEYAGKAIDLAGSLEYRKGQGEGYANLALSCLMTGNYDSSLVLLDQSLVFIEKIGHLPLKASVLNYKGAVYFNKGNLKEALRYFEESLDIKKQLNDIGEIVKTRYNIGSIYLRLNYLDKALENYLEVLRIDEARKDTIAMALDYNNIGLIYYDKKEYSKAYDYLRKCFAAAKTDKLLRANCLKNMGNIEQALKNPGKALGLYLDALSLFESLSNKKGIYSTYNNIGQCYAELGGLNKALDFYQQSLSMKKEAGDESDMASTTGNIGRLYLQMHDYRKAVEFAEKSNEQARINRDLQVIRNNYENMTMAYAALGDIGNMEKSNRLYHLYNDSILDHQTANRIAEMETKYETEKKEQALQLKSLEIEQQKATNRMQIILSVVIIVSVIILSLLFYNRYRLKQKALMEQESNRQQKLQFKAVLDAQEEERRRIAKELHDGVGNQLLSLQMAWKKAEPAVAEVHGHDPSLETISRIMKDVTEEVRNVSHRMMPKVLDEFGFVPAIQDMLEKALSYSGIKYNFETHNISERFDPRLEVAIYRITQELINNVIKHSNATMVNVQMLKSKEHLVLLVEDNGRGIKREDSTSSVSEGIGFKSIKSRLNIISGEINIEPGESTGTLVTIRIPLEYEPAAQNNSRRRSPVNS